jgi:hypothetical protein
LPFVAASGLVSVASGCVADSMLAWSSSVDDLVRAEGRTVPLYRWTIRYTSPPSEVA